MLDYLAQKFIVEVSTVDSIRIFLCIYSLLLMRLLLLCLLLGKCPLFHKVLLFLDGLKDIDRLDIFGII